MISPERIEYLKYGLLLLLLSTFIYLNSIGELFAVFPNKRRLHGVLEIPTRKKLGQILGRRWIVYLLADVLSNGDPLSSSFLAQARGCQHQHFTLLHLLPLKYLTFMTKCRPLFLLKFLTFNIFSSWRTCKNSPRLSTTTYYNDRCFKIKSLIIDCLVEFMPVSLAKSDHCLCSQAEIPSIWPWPWSLGLLSTTPWGSSCL